MLGFLGASVVTEGRLNASAWPASGPPGTRVAVKSLAVRLEKHTISGGAAIIFPGPLSLLVVEYWLRPGSGLARVLGWADGCWCSVAYRSTHMQSHFPLPSIAVYTPKFAMGSCVKENPLQTHTGSHWHVEGSKLELWVFPTVDAHGLLLVCFSPMHPLSTRSSVAELGPGFQVKSPLRLPVVSRQ